VSDWLDLYALEAEPRPGGVAIYLSAGDLSRGLVRLGRHFGDALGAYVFAIGPRSKEAAGWGADRVVEGGSLRSFVEKFAPEIVLFDASDGSIEQAARLGQQLGRSLLGPAFEAAVDPSTRLVVAKIRTYGGRQIEEVTAGEWRPQLIVMERESLPPAQEDTGRRVESIRI